MTLLMQHITKEDDDKILESIERLHYIAADRYDAIHHAVNFNSNERRMEAELFNGANNQSQSDCDRVLASFETLLEEAIEEHVEVSETTVSMKVWGIEASRRLKTVDSADFIARCQKFLQQIFLAAEGRNSLTEWSSWLLWKLGEVHYELSRFYIDEGHHEAGLRELGSCVTLFHVAILGGDVELTSFLSPRVCQYRNQLVQHWMDLGEVEIARGWEHELSSSGYLQEAKERYGG